MRNLQAPASAKIKDIYPDHLRCLILVAWIDGQYVVSSDRREALSQSAETHPCFLKKAISSVVSVFRLALEVKSSEPEHRDSFGACRSSPLVAPEPGVGLSFAHGLSVRRRRSGGKTSAETEVEQTRGSRSSSALRTRRRRRTLASSFNSFISRRPRRACPRVRGSLRHGRNEGFHRSRCSRAQIARPLVQLRDMIHGRSLCVIDH